MTTDSLRDRVLAAAAAAPSPTRARARRTLGVIVVSSVVIAAGVIAALGGPAHCAGRPVGATIALAAGWAAAASGLTWMVFRGDASTLVRAPGRFLAAATCAPLVLFGWMALFHATYPDPFVRFGWRCLGATLAVTIAPLFGILMFRRGSEPRRPAAVGAGIAAACACWAGAVVELWCPLTEPAHVVVGHLAPVLLAMALGAAMGPRLLGLRWVASPLRPGRS